MKKKRYYQAISIMSICALVGCTQWTQGYYQQGTIDQSVMHPYKIQQAMPTLSQPAHFSICGDKTSPLPCIPKTKLYTADI